MKLKSLKIKDKVFVFKSFENDLSENPAKIIFNRFPMIDEIFPVGNQKSVLDSNFVKEFSNTRQNQEKLVELIIDNIINNISNNRVDYRRFFDECVSHIENLEYDGKEIKTVKDFFEILPAEAAYKIAVEAYLYSKEVDLFESSEKKS